MIAELPESRHAVGRRTYRNRPDRSASSQQRSGLLIDDIVIDRFGHRQFLGLFGLDQLPLANFVDRTGHLGQHVPAPVLQAHVIRAGENIIADQHSRARMPQRIDRRSAATHVSLVHHIVVDQRSRMDHLDERGSHVTAIGHFAVQRRRQQHQQRTQLLAPVTQDVIGDGSDVAVVAVKDGSYILLIAADFSGYGKLYLFERNFPSLFHRTTNIRDFSESSKFNRSFYRMRHKPDAARRRQHEPPESVLQIRREARKRPDRLLRRDRL